MNPHVNNPVPGNPCWSITPPNCPRPIRLTVSQAGSSRPSQLEIPQEREQPPVNRERRGPRARATQACAEYLAILYPHISRDHLWIALDVADNNMLQARRILNMVYGYQFGSREDIFQPSLHPSASVNEVDQNRTTTAGPGTSSGTASVAPSAPACGITFGADLYGPLYGTPPGVPAPPPGTTSYVPVGMVSYVPVGMVSYIPVDGTSSVPYTTSPSMDVNNFYITNYYNQMVISAMQELKASYTTIPGTIPSTIPSLMIEPSVSNSSEMVLNENNRSAAVAMSEGNVLTTREHPNVTAPGAVYGCPGTDSNVPALRSEYLGRGSDGTVRENIPNYLGSGYKYSQI